MKTPAICTTCIVDECKLHVLRNADVVNSLRALTTYEIYMYMYMCMYTRTLYIVYYVQCTGTVYIVVHYMVWLCINFYCLRRQLIYLPCHKR